ncbi:elongin BC and Polycomb repressive complex 2-associated protein [Dendropsophus ebraccatus]|uniref:elongin BC and Polycomb repressive complex 2-associated protein n=1 Tax=Dendropsophus ebraccatus TaxID=150705 RepID=UPI003831A155
MEPRAGYQEIAGMRMGYLHVGGRQLFALAEVLSGPLRGVPRGRVCRRMERLHIQSRRCDLRELRALKALRSVPSRAVQCCLISREDLRVLCSSSWGPNTVISKEWMQLETDAPETPEKECVPSRMRATFPSELVDIFPSAPHSPATSVGYFSPSDSTIDQTSSSDTESDSSGDVYRSVEISKISRQIITRSRDCRAPNQPVKETQSALQDSSPSPPQESIPKESSEDKKCVTQECGQSPKIAEDNEEEASLPPEEEHDKGTQPVEPEPRVQQFDRLVRQSKLWCYARGFRTDLRDLHPAITRKCSKSPGAKRPGRPKGKGLIKKKKKKRDIGRRSASNPHAPVRPPFSFLGNFPAPPSLVVGEDGDLCPAYSLKTQDPKAVPRTHPVWGWHPGANAIPLPPSLKFRTFPIGHL